MEDKRNAMREIRKEIESFSGDFLLIEDTLERTKRLAGRMRVWEESWASERYEWQEERKKLEDRIKTLERTIAEMDVKKGDTPAAEPRRKQEKADEADEGKPLTEERWKAELGERKEKERNLAISAVELGMNKGKVASMLTVMTGKRTKEEDIVERKEWDGLKRWFIRMESVREKDRVVNKAEEIRKEWKVKVGVDSTYTQRQTRHIVEKRAEEEREKDRKAKVTTDQEWIGINDVWERWSEKDAAWMTEEEWYRKTEEEEVKALELKLEKKKAELKRREAHGPQIAGERGNAEEREDSGGRSEKEKPCQE